jgi:RimJ/RimL family protein N-acetyltransferase
MSDTELPELPELSELPELPDLPELTDGELRLRLPTDDDVDWITSVCQDPDIQRFTRVPSPYTTADAQHFVQLAADAWGAGTGVHLLVVEGDERLGAAGVELDRPDLSAEVGYWLAPGARGRGVATRATRLLCRFAFEHLGACRVGLMAAATNPGSNAVARRLGFTHEATLRQAMVDGPSGDPEAPRCDAMVWGLLPGELVG